MEDESRKIIKDIPTLAVDGLNLKISVKKRGDTYIDIRFFEDRGDKNVVVASVRLTPIQFKNLSAKIDEVFSSVNDSINLIR